MKSLIIALLSCLGLNAWAQDPYQDLNQGFRQFGEVMLATSGDVTSLELARTDVFPGCNPNADDPEQIDIDLGLAPEQNPESKWRFSVMVSMGGPRDGLAKHYANKGERYNEMGQLVRDLIATDYDSYDARMAAVSQMCQGLSEMDRIAMASSLGSQLSNIYDYDRTGDTDAADMVVRPQDQWNALHARANGNFNATSGVCRDASLTVSQFLLACGFKPDQVSIEGYRTGDAGHQVTSVRTSNGEVYTINWSELYASDENAHSAPAPNPNLINSGLYYTVYDPRDGRVVERRRTELGEVLKAVTGGEVDDPNHLPQLIRLEAGYGVVAANVFKTTTARGDFAQGVSTYINKDEIFGFLDISAGVAYVNNTRDVATSMTNSEELNQHIVYGQIEGRFRIPELMLMNRDDRSLSLRPDAVISTEGYWSNSAVDGGERESNGDQFTEGTIGLDGIYRQDRFSVSAGGRITGNLSERGFNNEQGTSGEAGNDGGYTPFVNSYNVHGAVSWQGDRLSLSATGDHTIARSGTRTAIGTMVMDHNNEASYSAVYSVYNRTYGTREDFLVLRAEKDFQINRVGTMNVGVQGQLPLSQDFNQAVVGVGVRFTPFSRTRRR